MFTILHRYNAGDLIVAMAGVKAMYDTYGSHTLLYQQINMPAFYYEGATHPVKDNNGVQVSMNDTMFQMLQPLIEKQPYIERFAKWSGEQVQIDFFQTRNEKSNVMPGGCIHHWPSLTFPQMSCDLSKKWIFTGQKKEDKGYVVINRTMRYYNPAIAYYFLKNIELPVFFVGTDDEYVFFKNQFDVPLQRYVPIDFLELACFIENSSLFIGNQSFCYHLAEAMKVPRVLEMSSVMPNTWPHGADGHIAATQAGLEYFVYLYTKG